MCRVRKSERGRGDLRRSPLLPSVLFVEGEPMGRYDNTKDTDGIESVALWKATEPYPTGVLTNFIETGTDEAPSLDCEDLNGTKYVLFGAWPRNVRNCTKQWGSNVMQWEDAVITLSKNKRQLELTPVKKVIIEEAVR